MTHIIEFVIWFAASIVLVSFLEHQVHRNLMHRKFFLYAYFKPFKKMFEHHAILHHGHYHSIFHDKRVANVKVRGIRLSLIEGFFEALLVAAPLAAISLKGAIAFETVVVLHHFVWNNIHMEMHKPENRFFAKWAIYRFLAGHHYLHHKHPNSNYNVVLPLADYILKTDIHPTRSELKEIVSSALS